MANLFTRIFRRPKLEEQTQLSSLLTLAGLLQYAAGESRDMAETARLATGGEAYNAYRTNPMGFNYVNVMTNFLFGPGVQFSHPDDAAQAALRDFLAKVKFGRKLMELSNGYHIDGIRFPVAYANTLTGEVKLREFDPTTVKNIVTAEDDYEEITGLYREYTERVWSEDGRSYRDEQKYEFVQQDDRVGGYTVRHFFVWKRPTVGGETRGWSFLTPVLHYLVQFREFVKTRLNLNKALAAFAWKWKLYGLHGSIAQKQTAAEDFREVLTKRIGAISAGSQLVSVPTGTEGNAEEGFDVDAITSGVTAGNSGAHGDARTLALQCAVGMSTPEGVATGDWSNANYSSLSLSIQTFIKNIQGEQTVWGIEGFLGEFFDWWLAIQRDAGLISGAAAEMSVNITWPIIIPYDLTQLKTLLEFLYDKQMITKRTALSITPFDVDFDAEQEELERDAAEEKARKEKEEAENPPPVIPPPSPPFGQAPPTPVEKEEVVTQ